MYYVEFIRKKPNVSWDEFNEVIRNGFKKWATLHPEDAPVLAAGRTWRLGPDEAPYLIVWKIPSFARIDEWSEVRRRDRASEEAIMGGTLHVADIQAGVYDDIGSEML